MKKVSHLILILIGLIILLVLAVSFERYVNRPSVHDATYLIGGQSFTLINGFSEVGVGKGSATKYITRYFGEDVTHDFDRDGRPDTAFIISQNTGGSGTFYYVVVRLNKIGTRIGSEAVLLGDRIAPQSMYMDEKNPDVLIVNFVDRRPTDSFAEAPSIGKSLRLKFDPETMQFGEVVADFEGEASPSVMKLTMKKWVWSDSDKFGLTFKDDGTVSISTDCNSGGGNYVTHGSAISFSGIVSTMMYCDGSREGEFFSMLSEVTGYEFTSKGELILNLRGGAKSGFK